MIDTAALIGFAIAAYLLGAVPFGLVVSKVMGLGDPRDIGSGNIGATNVLRTGSKLAGGLTLLLDMLKGLIPVLVGAWAFGPGGAQLGGIAAFLGHLFPIWLKFKGGKGVATFFGVTFGLAWPVGLACAAIWLGVAKLTRMSSAGALAATAASPILGAIFATSGVFYTLALIAVLIWIKHHANIKRILSGREAKIGDTAK